MPELPEVQTIVNGLTKKIIGKQILFLKEFRRNTVINHTEINSPNFGKIVSILRRGKYIVFVTSNGFKIVIHLRMTGKLIYVVTETELPAHTRAVFGFSDGSELVFDDTRAFGKVEIYKEEETVRALENLGIEPLSENFNENYLKNMFVGRKSPIKNLLLNQSIVAGLGNIYVCEILYRAEINPQVSGKNLLPQQIRKIVKQTKIVLKEAILHNGTTISDFRNIEDKTGEFQNFLRVYQKKECPKGNQIRKIKQTGRSTYFCPKCQRIDSQQSAVSKSAISNQQSAVSNQQSAVGNQQSEISSRQSEVSSRRVGVSSGQPVKE